MLSFAHVLGNPWKLKPLFWLITLGLVAAVLSGCAGVVHSSSTNTGNPPPSPLSITVSSLPAAQVQSSYTAVVSATGGTAPYHWSISSGALPVGLSLGASTGQVTGTPTAAGKATFTVQVSDSSATVQTASQALSIAVSATPASVTVTTGSLSNAVQGAAYSATLGVSGGTSPYTWTISSGSLPVGLTLAASTGVISGTPTTAGTSSFTVQVNDSTSPTAQTATKALSIITEMPVAITTSSLADGTQGAPYTSTLSAAGGQSNYNWSISSGSLPTGLSLTASTGTISGTPNTSGTYSFMAQVTDSTSPTPQKVNKKFGINISGPLTVTTTALSNGTQGGIYSATLAATGGTATYNWSISVGSLPAGLSLAASTGVISGTPTSSGVFSFTTQVTDSTKPKAEVATQALIITVTAVGTPLSVLTTSLAKATLGTAYSATLAASGGLTPYSWSIGSGSLPAGLNLAASTGTISGTPTSSGTFSFTVQVTDSTTPTAQTATKALSITVSVAPVSISTSSLSSATQGAVYGATLAAAGGTTPYSWSISSGSLPAGLSLTASTGVISGTPTTSGTFTFTVLLTDSTTPTAQTATKALSITVSVAPVSVSTSSLSSGTQGTAYSATLAAAGGTTPYSWSISSGSLPAGLSLTASTGVISGTPTTSGTFTFTVLVTDSTLPTAQTATKALSISIASSVPAVSITTSSLSNGTQGTAYSAMLAASGGTTPYTWSISSGSLPAGLSMTASTGVISGTPTTSGNFSFTVKVSDSTTPTAQNTTKALSISIASSVPAVSITTSSLSNGTQGTAYSATLAASGGTTPYTWSISSGSLPAGLSLTASTGAISGIPTTSGNFSFTVKASDSTTPTAQNATKALSISIASSVTAVSITTSSLSNGTQGTAYSATLAASGGTTPYTWSISSGSLPAGLSMTASTGLISGTPTTSGTFTFTVQVTDSTLPTAQNATKTLSVTVAATSSTLTITPPSVNFQNVVTGTTNTQTIKLTNSGTAALSISQVSVTGAGFSTSALSLPLSLNPGQSNTFNAQFAPTTAGSATGSISVLSNAANSPTTIPLSGAGVAQTLTLSFSSMNLAFGNVTTGTSSTQNITVTNTGNSNVQISQVAESGTGFSLTGAATPLSLTPNQSFTFSVGFSPTTVATDNGTVTVTSNASGSPATITLSGSGVAPTSHTVTLTWTASTSTVSGYNLYRSTTSGSGYVKLNSSLITGLTYTDSTVQSATTYYYVATAVDSSGNESTDSNQASAVIP